MPVVVSNCSNNYGPYHFPEKLIPLIILNALEGKALPVYGNGSNIRDWLYVEDHARALDLIAERGRVGETYNIGGRNERRNIDVVERVCAIMDELSPTQTQHRSLICYVTDRPGHDARYAIDATKLETELGGGPQKTSTPASRKPSNGILKMNGGGHLFARAMMVVDLGSPRRWEPSNGATLSRYRT